LRVLKLKSEVETWKKPEVRKSERSMIMVSRKNSAVFSGLLIVSVMFLMGPGACPLPLNCVDFESLTPGTTYLVGDSFMDSGVPMVVTDFQWSGGAWYSGGEAEVIGGDCALDGSGLAMWTNNVNIDFGFPVLANGLTLNFAEYGGNVNIEVNGDLKNVENFVLVDGTYIGGVYVTCSGAGCNGQGQGILKLDGNVTSFRIGGQEFCMDNVCPIL